ncbi:hypothetical protein [Nitrospirillum iridis]|uniref:Uncharacterized protein n=1 Tax=Nitrospirillum iridis TaxID=765888 RepID=A0A7X0B2J4_9PROT|nr:hypothetical protein [Nitrospirillum iridis]MBB6253044.1 hypothetical protein [Nitrospirillum iridis]
MTNTHTALITISLPVASTEIERAATVAAAANAVYALKDHEALKGAEFGMTVQAPKVTRKPRAKKAAPAA